MMCAAEPSDKKMASYLYRTAQPLILAAFLPWGVSAGAGRIRLATAKVSAFYRIEKHQSI